ncbi:MAG: hypothetical protein RI947_1214 [Candidatus Parcubacteria bacterium]|jgi:hypothetical protein
MFDTTNFTPADFDGIFYSEDSGSEAIFEYGADFLELIRERRDGLFLALGAHVDLRVYGKRADIADALLERARSIWTEADWSAIDQMLATVDQLRVDQPQGWRHTVFQMVEAAVMPKSHKMPEQFTSYFLDASVYQLLFGMRAAAFNKIKAHGADLRVAVMLLVGLHLNGEAELVTELEEALPYFWDGVDLPVIHELYTAADQARSSGSPIWTTTLGATIAVAMHGYAVISSSQLAHASHAHPTPVDFDPIFLQDPDVSDAVFTLREEIVDMFAGRREAMFVLTAAIIDLRINDQGKLAEAVLAKARADWTEQDFTVVDRVLAETAALAESRPESWRKTIYALVHDELEPKLPELPESFQNFFVPRDVMQFVVANRADGLGMLYASGTELARAVKVLVVVELNDDPALLAELEALLPELYPRADMTRIRSLYTAVRSIKAEYGDLWMSFAVAHIDMTINGSATIDWNEGAA